MSRLLPSSLLLLILLAAAGCGGGKHVVSDGRLPDNVMTTPRGKVGIISADENNTLVVALRALGVQARRLSLDSLAEPEVGFYSTLMVDEGALEDARVIDSWRHLLFRVRTGATMIILSQPVKPMAERLKAMPHAIVPRAIEYQPKIVAARRSDPVLQRPNVITQSDLDTIAPRVRQLVAGGNEARGMITGSAADADSSAILLWDRFEQGTLWYLAAPIVAQAAAGAGAEQRLLANLISNR